MILVDRSRIEADWRCPRERYWLTEYQGTGMVPAEQHVALTTGIILHHGLEHIQGDAVRAMRQLPEYQLLDDDHRLMVEALVVGFQRRVFPSWLEEYELVALEQELEFEAYGVLYMCRPDMLLRHRRDGTLWYPDFKSFARWGNRKWPHALQQQLTMRACEQAVGEKLTGCWIQGLDKGYEQRGELYHKLVYGYRRPGEPGIAPTAYSVRYKARFERFRTDQHEGGVEGWIDALSEEDIASIYPRTPPIFPNEWMMEEFLKQRAMREVDIASCRDKPGIDLGLYFPQNFGQCETNYSTCPYLDACWTPAVREDPLGSGLFVPRTPHHKSELDLKGGT